MEFEIRELQARDIAPMTRILSNIGIKQIASSLSPDSLREIVAASVQDEEADEGKGGEGAKEGLTRTEEIGMNIMLEVASVLCANFDKAESDLFSFMASMSGMKQKEVSELSLADTFDLMLAIVTSDGFSDFFKRVQALLAK